jgi:hypothetical protein
MIPRRKGDTPNPRGGVRHVIPLKGDYDDAIFSCDLEYDTKEEIQKETMRTHG